MLHNAVTGVFVHGLYLGGVFIALQQHLPAGVVALVVSLQPCSPRRSPTAGWASG